MTLRGSHRFAPYSPWASFNSSSPSVAYMHQCIGSALVQIIACHLFGAKPLYLNQCWIIFDWNLRNKFQWNFNQDTKLFLHKIVSENVFCKMAAILSRGTNLSTQHDAPQYFQPMALQRSFETELPLGKRYHHYGWAISQLMLGLSSLIIPWIIPLVKLLSCKCNRTPLISQHWLR